MNDDMGLVDTRDMVWVHGALRGEFTRLRETLSASAAADDDAWGRYLDHWRLMYDFLVEHHTGEDRLLWPVMRERLPDEQEVILRMETEHHTLHQLLEDANDRVLAVDAARGGGDSGALRSSCADAEEMLRVMSTELEKHLEDEEAQFLPLVPGILSEEEWGALGAEASEILGPRNALLVLGYVLKWMAEPDRPVMLSKVPPEVADVWAATGAAEFDVYEAGLLSPN